MGHKLCSTSSSHCWPGMECQYLQSPLLTCCLLKKVESQLLCHKDLFFFFYMLEAKSSCGSCKNFCMKDGNICCHLLFCNFCSSFESITTIPPPPPPQSLCQRLTASCLALHTKFTSPWHRGLLPNFTCPLPPHLICIKICGLFFPSAYILRKEREKKGRRSSVSAFLVMSNWVMCAVRPHVLHLPTFSSNNHLVSCSPLKCFVVRGSSWYSIDRRKQSFSHIILTCPGYVYSVSACTHDFLAREHSATVVSACWATVGWP